MKLTDAQSRKVIKLLWVLARYDCVQEGDVLCLEIVPPMRPQEYCGPCAALHLLRELQLR